MYYGKQNPQDLINFNCLLPPIPDPRESLTFLLTIRDGRLLAWSYSLWKDRADGLFLIPNFLIKTGDIH
ncbi:hypothetical protein SINU_04670 [Sporolactobacillus inulinus CASD]|uniref:Uncharacterized protein n=2 Tax=Sporolactobacillus TaxID=2077 RepID=A0A0U1QQP9_9BACL|nr:hypothetical protein SINU_04670 [Sporolactobacillus inulinus CASD]QAA21918.1 hypothetical protein C0674_04415 [Sporolactobacillus terrae]QAA24891.1 hypothetical protein C0679_04390 [Sporolactobacillus terrae]GEB78071.1 hypothetical protein SIN01_24160 [Sporolactobacillus inulinus]